MVSGKKSSQLEAHRSARGSGRAMDEGLAETEGFEPSVREYPVRRFSKPLVSATHPRLRARLRKRGYSGAIPKLQPERLSGE